jgi:multidrug efflux pump subunit AcrB
MPGSSAQSKTLQYVGVLVAVTAIIGYIVFGWQFGSDSGPVPVGIGITAAVFAVGWTLYQRAQTK